ncbi:hypothetical protein NC653_038586 [Populus alba x Populus x berolinensis]|uniref:Uncharacterized protein n=1 Tax=Populus alba x Populus x berolinensis TaxID=444605 RepID=A0AAD6LH86_9ROSI|nr:hypothetical protein NC653_038586 [Populus alba x Populus x berolinensis]
MDEKESLLRIKNRSESLRNCVFCKMPGNLLMEQREKGAKPKILQHLLLAAFSQAKEKDEKDCTSIPGLMVLARLLASRLSFVFTFFHIILFCFRQERGRRIKPSF